MRTSANGGRQPAGSFAAGGPEQAAAIGGMVGGLLGGCLGMVCPVLLLIFMCRRNVAEASRP